MNNSSYVYVMIGLLLSLDALCQPPSAPPSDAPIAEAVRMSIGPAHSFRIMHAQYSFPGEVVENAPYSADAITETTQTLADGNRIRHRNEARVYRDSEGRTRREQIIHAAGPWQTHDEPSQMVFINDPVAEQSLALNPATQTAHRLPAGDGHPVTLVAGRHRAGQPSPAEGRRVIRRHPSEDAVYVNRNGNLANRISTNVTAPDADTAEPAVSEDLGHRSIEGIDTVGTRTRTTIPAGAVGNDLPIEVVTERWFSPDLRVLLESRHTDPRLGEVVYRLVNISLDEPEASLFRLPENHTLEDPLERPETDSPESDG